MDTMEQYNTLKRCREGHGYTQVMLGRLLGFQDGSLVSRWEHGKDLPNLEGALKLSILLDTPVNDLFSDLVEKAKAAIRDQAMVVSSDCGVQGLPQNTEQPEEVPQGEGAEAKGCDKTPGI